jgi:hypothetical protein
MSNRRRKPSMPWKWQAYAAFAHITTWYYRKHRDALLRGDQHIAEFYQKHCEHYYYLSLGNQPNYTIVKS